MGQEIERKFLIRREHWRFPAEGGVRMTQCYLEHGNGLTVRLRRIGDTAFLTLKGSTCGCTRSEFEYEIPVADAEAMLRELPHSPPVEKIRYRVPEGNGLTWEVDFFEGDNAGLIVAEIELPAEDRSFERPEWLDREVTGEARYCNSMLAVSPYKLWSDR